MNAKCYNSNLLDYRENDYHKFIMIGGEGTELNIILKIFENIKQDIARFSPRETKRAKFYFC